MKRLLFAALSVLLAVCLLATFVACGTTPTPNPTPNNPQETPDDKPGNTPGNPNENPGTKPGDTPTPAEQFTISFYDENGSLLESKKWDKNATPSYVYEKQNTDEYTYVVEGWATSANGTVLEKLPAVTGDASYFAIVTKTEKTPEVAYTGQETTAEDVKVSANLALSQKFAAESASMSADAKIKADVVYTICQLKLAAVSGTVEQANEVYAEACAVLKALNSAVETLDEIKQQALVQLDAIYNGVKSVVTTVSAEVEAKYQQVKTTIQQLSSPENRAALEEGLKEFANMAARAIADFAAQKLEELKTALKSELDTLVGTALDKIEDAELKTELQTFYNAEMAKIDAIDSIDTAKTTLAEIKSDTLAKVQEITKSQISKYATALRTELDQIVAQAIAKLDDAELKTELQTFYNAEMAKIDAIDSLDTAKTTLAEIKSETIAKAQEIAGKQLKKLKDNAIAELNSFVAEYLTKIDDETLQAQLTAYYNEEIAKIQAIDSLDSAKTTIATVVTDTKNFAKELAAQKIAALKETLKTYVSGMSSALSVSAFNYLPQAMCPGYALNLVTQESVTYDFATDFVNVADVNYGGFGAQWNMVVENINRMESCFKVFNMADSALKLAIVAANEYLGSKYTDTINTTIDNDTFTLVLNYTESELRLAVSYKSGVSVPQLGNVTPTIDLTYDVVNATNTVFIKLTDTNAVKYSVSPDCFEFAITLGLSVGNVTSYCKIDNSGSTSEGKIYESIAAAGKELKSTAEFYVDDTYVTVVGSKADTIVGFKGYVCELYKKNEGKLLGFEVKETLSSKTYNTLWFNLTDLDNLSSIKVTDKNNNKNVNSQNDTYLNGKTEAFYVETKSVFDPSRKYDVEMKLRYFYGVNAQGELEKYEVSLPMMFVQEECKDSFVTDMANNNNKRNNWATDILTPEGVLTKLMDEYAEKIDAFIAHKDDMTTDDVKTYIGVAQA